MASCRSVLPRESAGVSVNICGRVTLMADATKILRGVGSGNAHAAGELLPLVYEELRKLARCRMGGERASHTLQATALVHEAYLRLMGDAEAGWENRAHFFA